MTPQQIEAMKLALEALELINIEFVCGNGSHHKKEDRHKWDEDCPITNRWRKAITAIKEALAQPEQEPVAWLLTDKNINSIQVDSIQRLIDRLKHAHHTDIRVRINGHDEWFEADWLKHMVRVTPPQPEQNPMSDEMLQAITDPENQPSQYGTVTLDYHFEKIKKWEDLFERMSNKVLQQPKQEPVIDKSAAIRIATSLGWTPQRKPLTDEEIEKLADDFLAYQIEDYQVSGVFTFARAIEAAHGIKGEA